MGFDNIVNQGLNGYGLAITGMSIVFTVLVLVSLFIAGLPRLLPLVEGLLPPVKHGHNLPVATKPRTQSGPTATDEEIIAAIGFALHHHRQQS